VKWRKAAWKSLKYVTTNFLGNHEAQNYRDTVADLAQSYKDVKRNMPVRVHFLDCHLDLLPENIGAVNDEHG